LTLQKIEKLTTTTFMFISMWHLCCSVEVYHLH